jgi:phosphatidylglycerophosphatase A
MSAPAPLDARTLCSHPLGWVATGLGSGLSPRAPGTVGSLAALLPWLLLSQLSVPVYLLVVALVFALGTWASNWVIARTGVHDPGAVVIDEWVGLWIALLLVPEGWPWVLCGLLAFRFFDILKPWPIGWADRRIKGGLGVMVDDVIAGLFALAVVQALAWAVGQA